MGGNCVPYLVSLSEVTRRDLSSHVDLSPTLSRIVSIFFQDPYYFPISAEKRR